MTRRTCDSSVIHIAAICGTEFPTPDANKIAARSRVAKCLAFLARLFNAVASASASGLTNTSGGRILTSTNRMHPNSPPAASFRSNLQRRATRRRRRPRPFYPRGMASERHVTVGGVQIGAGAPVVVQTMTKTETANLAATMEQIHKVAEAGADLVRVAVPRDKDIEALKTIVVQSPIPIIADIHFNHTLALKAIDAGAHCIRLNPGNIGGPEKVAEVADRARAAGTPM